MGNEPLTDGTLEPSAALGGRLSQVAAVGASEKLAQKMKEISLGERERESSALAAKLSLPYFSLQGFPITTDALGVVPQADAQRLQLVCFWIAMNDLRVAAVDPTAPDVQQYIAEIGRAHRITPTVYVVSEASLKIGIEAYRRLPKIRAQVGGVEIGQADIDKAGGSINTLTDIAASLATTVTTEAITAILAGALKTRSSDVHIEAEEVGITVRYRIDGVLYTVATLPRSTWEKTASRLKLLSGLKINVTDRPQDGRFTIHLKDDKVDVRVSTLPTSFGESIVMRLLKWSASGVSFDDLGLIGRAKERLAVEMKKPNGMIVSTGPTGSGKTTTLYAILTTLNDSETKIITLEDPVEYKLKGVNQSQVDTGQGFTFANGLRSILRQDPDIIMVGEIRDLETADIAANAALTGHLVLTTLHTNNAAGAIPRLLGMGVKAFLLPPSIGAVIGQRLVRRICEFCKTDDAIDADTQKIIDTALSTLPAEEKSLVPATIAFQKGKGCEACQGLGFKGQIGIYEILTMTKDLETAILEAQISDTKIQELAIANGMVTMLQDGILKALQGVTSMSEVLRVTQE